jgi:hypothetical protein
MILLGTFHGAFDIWAQDLRLKAFQDVDVKCGGHSPELYAVGPYGFKYSVVKKEFVTDG